MLVFGEFVVGVFCGEIVVFLCKDMIGWLVFFLWVCKVSVVDVLDVGDCGLFEVLCVWCVEIVWEQGVLVYIVFGDVMFCVFVEY